MGDRLIGVDYGRKRVGLAMADPLGVFAHPIGTYDPRQAVEELKKIAEAEGISEIVVGWPLLPDGTEGEMTRRVQEYINRLRNAFPGVEVIAWDERHTSEMARGALVESSRLKLKHGFGVDAVAACVILQDYLER